MTFAGTRFLRALPIVGAAGASGASLLAMGCCLGPAVLTTALTAAGLAGLLGLDMGVTVPILYAMVGLSFAGIAWASWRPHNWLPLALAVLGAVALLIPFHEALDVRLFYVLVFGGQVALLAAAALAAWAARRGCLLAAAPVTAS